MTGLWTKLRQRKLVQWTLAYVAFAFALLQAVDIVATRFGWPALVEKLVILALCVGLVLTLILAWYHGEQGRQRVSGIELMILAVVLAVGGGFLWQFTRTPNPPAGSIEKSVARPAPAQARPSTGANIAHASSVAIPAKSIAVLPFENLSTDKANGYFADGMQDLILTKLADIGGLKVMSRTATLKYRSHPDDLDAIARHLRVATILEGSVQKAGNQVLINVQLIDARSGGHLWAQSYQRTLDNIFGVEGEVAQKIAAALDARLSATEQRDVAAVPTRNPAAYDAYLRGKHDANMWAEELNYKLIPDAVKSFQRAVKLDPGFALAWANLADLQTYFYNADHPKAVMREADANARRALALAPRLPEAHYAMAEVQLYVHQDDRSARSQLQQALALRPSYADALGLLAQIEFYHEGDLDGGITYYRRAVALDPNSASASLALARALQMRGNYGAARSMAQRAIALAPNNTVAYLRLGVVDFYQRGDVSAVLKALDRIPATAPNQFSVNFLRAEYLVMQRNYAAARRAAARIPQDQEMEREMAAFTRGYVEWMAGDKAAARPYLRSADRLFRKQIASLPDQAGLYARDARALAMLGDKDKALQQIRVALQIERHHSRGRMTLLYVELLTKLAEVQVITGDRDGAIGTLKKITASSFPLILPAAELRANPVWDPLRADPRFQALLKHQAQRKPPPLPAEDSRV